MSTVLLAFMACERGLEAQFQLSSPLPTSVGLIISEHCIADVTGDTLPDLIAINGGGTLAIARGIGAGLHGEVVHHPRGEGIDGLVRGLAAGDLEGDGDQDLVFTWSHPMNPGGFVSVLVFENGVPGDRIDYMLDPLLNRVPFDLSLSDLNGDGRLDIVLCTTLLGEAFQPAAVTVLIGVANSAIPDYLIPQHYPRSSMARDVEVADLDLDGDPDVVLSCREGDSLSIFENVGNGQLALASEYLFPESPHPYSVAVGDLDQNGLPDLLLGTWMNRSLIPFLATGSLQFDRQAEIMVGQFGWGIMHRIRLHDMNADGHSDAVIPFSSGLITTLYGDGQGDFPDQDWFVTYQSAKGIGFTDLDGNGSLEMILEHTDMQLFTTFFGDQELRGRVYFEPAAVSAGLNHELPLKVTANLGIRGADLTFHLDPSILQPQSLVPSSQLMTATAGNGPDFWWVDLGGTTGESVTLSTIIDDTGLYGLGAGLVNDLALFSISVSDLPQDEETTLTFDSSPAGGSILTVTGGLDVPVSHDVTPIQVVVPTRFLRGDVNENGSVNVGDAVVLLRRMFGLDPPGNCLSASDTDADGNLDLSDAIRLLTFLFSGGDAPEVPYPDCGIGLDPLLLPCESHLFCP